MKRITLILVTLLSSAILLGQQGWYKPRKFISTDYQDTIFINEAPGAISGLDSVEVNGVWYVAFAPTPEGNSGDVLFSDGANGFTTSEGLVAGRAFNWTGNYLDIGNYNTAGTDYFYFSPQDGDLDIYHESGSSYWEIYVDPDGMSLNSYNTNGYGGYLSIESEDNPSVVFGSNSSVGIRTIHYDTTGLFFTGHNWPNITDNHVITKGYADANYSGGTGGNPVLADVVYIDGDSDSLASKERVDSAEYRIEALEYPMAVTENITVYVDTSGNDTTGDGTSLLTAYRTLNKALTSANKYMLGVLTIQFGSGVYTYTADDISQINSFYGGGAVDIVGTMVEVISNLTLSYSDGTGTTDPFVYDALVNGSDPGWTVDEIADYYIANDKYTGGLYYPILGNTSNTVEYSISYSPTDAYGVFEQTTELTYDSELTDLNIVLYNNQISALEFIDLEFTSPTIIDIINTIFNTEGCRFNIGALTKDLKYSRQSVGIVSGCEFYGGVTFNENGFGVMVVQRSIFHSTDLLAKYSTFKVSSTIFNGGARGLLIRNLAKKIGGNAIIDNYLKFKNITTAIDLIDGDYNQDLSNQYYILDNVTNFIDLSNNTKNTNVRGVGLDYIIGSPTSSYVIGDAVEDYNSDYLNFYFNLKGVTFPNQEFYGVETIPNNSGGQDSLSISVGRVDQNQSININYTIARGDSLESGEIRMSMTADSCKIVYLEEYGDDINVSFNLDLEDKPQIGTIVNLVAKLEDAIATDATITLGNVNRTLK